MLTLRLGVRESDLGGVDGGLPGHVPPHVEPPAELGPAPQAHPLPQQPEEGLEPLRATLVGEQLVIEELARPGESGRSSRPSPGPRDSLGWGL